MDTPKVALDAYQRLQLELAKEELRRAEMEQLKAKTGMAGDNDYAGEPPLRIDSLETIVGTLCDVVRRLEVSLQVPDRAHDPDADETEKRLLSSAESVLEAKLARLGHTIERCNFEITECVGAIDRIQAKIGS